MLEELRALIADFKRADAVVTPTYMELWKQYGVDEAFIARESRSEK